jgi:hypothetical protein
MKQLIAVLVLMTLAHNAFAADEGGLMWRCEVLDYAVSNEPMAIQTFKVDNFHSQDIYKKGSAVYRAISSAPLGRETNYKRIEKDAGSGPASFFAFTRLGSELGLYDYQNDLSIDCTISK